jgi:hypothetical protein
MGRDIIELSVRVKKLVCFGNKIWRKIKEISRKKPQNVNLYGWDSALARRKDLGL